MSSVTDSIVLAEEAADQLFDAGNEDVSPVYEPRTPLEARAAVQRLGKRFQGLPGAISEALEAARESANLISSDRLQGISEIVQNADDVDASEVRIMLETNNLWICHDGSPVRLRHVLGFATPWLSTKGSEAGSTGRFGIGLMTLRAVSNTLEVHCHPYHVQLGEPILSPVDPPNPPLGLNVAGWTMLRVPIESGDVNQEELEQWLNRWDDAALLFLRSVSRVTLLDKQGSPVRHLAISRHDATQVPLDERDTTQRVSRQRVEAADGRSWIVYAENVAAPYGVSRARKATDATTSVAVAFPQFPVDQGQIHAGLPVTRTLFPIFANAQFDPLTNRRDFADNEWNRALAPLVTALWSQASLDLFLQDPKAAWQAMPIQMESGGDGAYSFTSELEEAITIGARQRIASNLSSAAAGHGKLRLSQLAVEAQPLESILNETETADLAGLPATLPFEVRDQGGKWRTILEDWRTHGANIPEEVSVERALALLGDPERPTDSMVALTAAGLDAGLNERLMELPCVVARDGRHIIPPGELSADALADETTPLAEQLGLVTLLHPVHLGEAMAARTVLKWLRESRALLSTSDDQAVVQRLAAAGRAGREIEAPLTDEQVQSLRAAFELMDPAERESLGEDVGKAIRLQATEYELRGSRRIRKGVIASPLDAYLPKAIDSGTDSFAASADQSTGIVWLSSHYARILRSPTGRQGVGAQRFLVLLGAATAPRLRLHPGLERRYSDPRLGLRARLLDGPAARSLDLEARDANFTLQDRDCPALVNVAQDISRIRRGSQKRRGRAAALLATMARSWDRAFGEFAMVDSARDYHGWDLKGQTPAFWLWETGAISWLDDESGTPRRPSELRVRTPGNEAIYGKESRDYLHSDFNQPSYRVVLAALGVSGDPSRSELVTRLKEIRDAVDKESRWTNEELRRETAIIYKALAQSLADVSGRSHRGAEQLRRDFQYRGGLIFSNLGWLPPQAILAGSPIFGKYKAFAPNLADTERLWEALRLREPSFEDCLDVVRAIARNRRTPGPEEEAILLETMRALESRVETGVTSPNRAKLRQLPLWTSEGWMRSRPVYATGDSVLAASLRDHIPLWQPGGELSQFRELIELLRVEEIDADDAEVVEPHLATEHGESSEFYGAALQQLQEDLLRNDPQLARSVKIPWDIMGDFGVCVHPTLSLGITTRHHGAFISHECRVTAKVDKDRGIIFVQGIQELARVDSGGRAIASLFGGEPRLLAQAWRAACDRAEVGHQARHIELADQRAKREQEQIEMEIEARTTEVRDQIAAAQGSQDRSRGSRQTQSGPSKAATTAEEKKESTRVLVNPESLEIVDPEGRLENSEQRAKRTTSRERGLVEQRQGNGGPRDRSPIRLYTDIEKESVGLDLFRRLLSSDVVEIADLRTQHGVGADAIDSLKHFYELKVSAGPEPDYITMTAAEVKRARTIPDFFLVVISGVEGVDARPKVRIIADPLSQLQPMESGSITLSGVRSARSLAYDFAPVRGTVGSENSKDAIIMPS